MKNLLIYTVFIFFSNHLNAQNIKRHLNKDSMEIELAMHSFCHSQGKGSDHPTMILHTNLDKIQINTLLKFTFTQWVEILNDSNTVHGAIAVLYQIRSKQSTCGNFKQFRKYFSGNKLLKEVTYWKKYLKNTKLKFMELD